MGRLGFRANGVAHVRDPMDARLHPALPDLR
jgi:hypothetical protein